MSIGGSFGTTILPADHQRALADGTDWLIDRGFDDIAQLEATDTIIADISIVEHLPARYLPRYTPLLVRQFLVCVVTVAWKLAQPAWLPLTCVAEELALRAIIAEAEAVLERAGQEADFTAFEDVAFEDTDFEFLFEPASDGIDDSAVGAHLGMGSLNLADWFKPFGAGSRGAVHPYVDDGTGAAY